MRVAYQVAGAGQKPAAAWFDPALCPDAEEFLTERLDKLAWCRVEDEPPPDPPVPPPVEPAYEDDADQVLEAEPVELEPMPAVSPVAARARPDGSSSALGRFVLGHSVLRPDPFAQPRARDGPAVQ